MYADGEYDLAGFAVGVVEKSAIIDGRDDRAGRRRARPRVERTAFERLFARSAGSSSVAGADLRAAVRRASAATLGDALLAPTRIYVKPVLALMQARARQGHGAHHRRRPARERAAHAAATTCRRASSGRAGRVPPIFDWLQQHGNVADDEMHRVFNCGIGMVLVVAGERRAGRASMRSARRRKRVRHRRDRARGPARRRRSSRDTVCVDASSNVERMTLASRPNEVATLSPMALARITILISGRGSNMAALIDAAASRPNRRRGDARDQQPCRTPRDSRCAQPRHRDAPSSIIARYRVAHGIRRSARRRRSIAASPTSSCSPASCACSAPTSCKRYEGGC